VSADATLRVLVNLPAGFFRTPQLEPIWDRLASMAQVRKTSHDTPEQIHDDLAWAQAVIMWAWPTLGADMLADASDLKFAGHINLGAETARNELAAGMTISELRHGWSPAVAELALTLLLAGLRKTSAYHIAMRQGAEQWIQDMPADVDPQERQLTGRTVGIVGLGGIGRRLAQLLEPFQVKLLACDPYVSDEVLAAHGAERATVDDLAGQAEAVVLCAANTAEARHLLGREQIESMRPGAVLVNVGRASLVDMDALQDRLSRGELIAMLDVFESEPLPAEDPLRKLPNAFLTPHRGGGIMESMVRILSVLIDDLEHWRDGQPLACPVTEETLHCLA
jgi:phosphoglycerate dehydrogenase-like enzyme